MIARACVIGAGIAGITTALALERAGVHTQVYEHWPELRCSGGPLMLLSNAVSALHTLDLSSSLLAVGMELDGMEFKRRDGRLLWTMPVGAASRRHGWPGIVVPRAKLMALLAERLQRPIQFGARYAAHIESDAAVELLFEDGSRVVTDLLIGADGARSRVRQQFAPEHPAFSTGQIAWLGHSRVRDRTLRRGTSTGTLGRGLRFWSAAIDDGEVSWYAVVQDKHQVATRADLARLFASFHAPIPHLIDAASEDNLWAVEILDQDPLLRWSSARATLVGDAAHCFRPDIGQGAGQAIESAVALAEEVGRGGRSVTAALRAYERRRRARSARVQLLARTTALHIAVEQPALCAARDLAVGTTFPLVALPALEWLLSA
jgi:2-polyprenyl-6-methoxyphenol hydroxylase-like FAD-dependent oxidoreductase